MRRRPGRLTSSASRAAMALALSHLLSTILHRAHVQHAGPQDRLRVIPQGKHFHRDARGQRTCEVFPFLKDGLDVRQDEVGEPHF